MKSIKMKSCLPIILFSLIAFLAKAQITLNPAQEASVDSLFQNWNDSQSPGGVIAVVSNGKVIYNKAYGMADVENQTPITINTVFNLASNAKQFVGMCIALLDEQNKLSTNDDLKKYYPKFKLPNGIKLTNLLDHTSGIREAYVLAVLSGKVGLTGQIRRKYNTREYLFEMLKRQEGLNFNPGDEVAYTNINYILLADIVEKVSGTSLRDFADSAIFRPLQMNHTRFQYYGESVANIASGYAYSTTNKFTKGKVWNGVKEDLNLLSSIDDLIKWDSNFYTNTLGKNSNSLTEQILTSTYLNDGRTTNYNYGLSRIEYRGIEGFSHGGDNYLHTSLISRYPEFKLSIICLANSGRYYDVQQKVDKITDILFKGQFKDEPSINGELEYINVNLASLKEKTGKYGAVNDNGLADYLEVNLRDGRLFMTPMPNFPGFELKPVSTNRFIAFNPEGEMIDLTFSMDDQREWEIHQHFRNEEKIIARLQTSDQQIDYGVYEGKYYNKSVGTSIDVKTKKDKIIARKGFIKIDLIPFGKDSFFAPENDALFLFSRDGKGGRIESLVINASDFRNFKFERKE